MTASAAATGWAFAPSTEPCHPRDFVRLEVSDIVVQVLTGVYSEETHRPQPLRISVSAEIAAPQRFEPDTPLAASKNYLDLRHAIETGLPEGCHFTLVEAVADHIAETLLIGDERVRRVKVKIVKLALASAGESIGMTLVRERL